MGIFRKCQKSIYKCGHSTFVGTRSADHEKQFFKCYRCKLFWKMSNKNNQNCQMLRTICRFLSESAHHILFFVKRCVLYVVFVEWCAPIDIFIKTCLDHLIINAFWLPPITVANRGVFFGGAIAPTLILPFSVCKTRNYFCSAQDTLLNAQVKVRK